MADARPDDRRRGPLLQAILTNVATGYVNYAVDALTVLILIPFILEHLGQGGYGLWAWAWAAVSLLSLLDLGFTRSAVKLVADAVGRGDPARHRAVTATLFWIYAAQGAAVLLLVAIAYGAFDTIVDVPPEHRAAAPVVLLVLGGALGLGAPGRALHSVLVGHHKEWIVSAVSTVSSALAFVAVLVVLPTWPDVRALALVSAVFQLLPNVALALLTLSSVSGVTVAPRAVRRGAASELWSLSWYFMLTDVSLLVATRVDALVIEAGLSLRAVAFYAAAMRMADAARALCSRIPRSMMPAFAELAAADDPQRVRALLLSGSKYTVAFATPLLLGAVMLSAPLVVGWVGEPMRPAAPVLALLLVAVWGTVVHAGPSSVASMIGRHRAVAVGAFAGQCINLALSVALVGPWGIVGVAAATGLGTVPAEVAVFGACRATLGVGWLEYYRHALLPSLLPGAVALGGLWLVRDLAAGGGLLAVGALELGACAVFWLLFLVTATTRSERQALRSRLF